MYGKYTDIPIDMIVIRGKIMEKKDITWHSDRNFGGTLHV